MVTDFGGGTHIYHYFQPRALTNYERARLQTSLVAINLWAQNRMFANNGMDVAIQDARIFFQTY